jgi:thioredoxin 1
LPKNRVALVLLAAIGLAVVAVGGYLLFFSGSDHVEGHPSFVYFRLPTWEFCKEMNPIVDEVKKNYNDRVNFEYVDLSTSDGKLRGKNEGVMTTPTFLLLDAEGERVFMIQGVYPQSVLEQHLEDLLDREA